MSIFDPHAQADRVEFRVIAALERLSEAFRVLLWEKAKKLGLSPIQIQLLLFIRYHPEEYSRVSWLAREFSLTPPTISEAIKSLEKKGLLTRRRDLIDTRSHTLLLTELGKEAVSKVSDFADVMLQGLMPLEKEEKGFLLELLMRLIAHLQGVGVIGLQRMCFLCAFYRQSEDRHFCRLLKKPLTGEQLRIDCPEHVPRKEE
jgi:DNA-binding MarR family transcriptional regulator